MKKFLIIVISILLSAMAFGVIASSLPVGDFGSGKDKTDSITNDSIKVVNYEPDIYMLQARDSYGVSDPLLTLGGGGQEWTPVISPTRCVGYSFDIDSKDYFDFEECSGGYSLEYSLEENQFYSFCVKSYDSNEVKFDISGVQVLGSYKSVYDVVETGDRFVYVTYFCYSAESTSAKAIVDTNSCEVMSYITPFELFETGYIAICVSGTMIDYNTVSGYYQIQNALAGKYFSNNYTGDSVTITVDGDSSVVSEIECWTSNSNEDMMMFETYCSGMLEIANPGTIFSVFNAISEPLDLPVGMTGEKVSEYILSDNNGVLGINLDYTLTAGNYVLVVSELYDHLGLNISIDGGTATTKDCAAGSHLITIPDDGAEHTVSFSFSERASFSKGRFVMFKVNN